MDVTDEKKQEHGHGHSHDHAEGEHAEIVGLGAVTVAGSTFIVDREGQVAAGGETEFGVEHVGGAKTVPSMAWLENPDGEKLCDPVVGEGHDQHWHFKVTPLMPVKKSKFVLMVDGVKSPPLDFKHGAKPCNGGILAVFNAGFLELKLHDDAGDLELWLYAPSSTADDFKRNKPDPFDLPKDSVIRLTFPNHDGKTIELRIRNDDKNEDEEGKPNMRGGVTNYFIFPGESEQDPKWLMGEKWRGTVTMAFESGGKSYVCDPFVLVPHGAL